MGIRGVPAAHGGFETFAERLAPYLIGQGWDVTVYCQADQARSVVEDIWCGVRRVHVPVRAPGALGTIEFDLRSHVEVLRRRPSVALTLGYNTAIFGLLLRAWRIPNAINMDGIEWQRDKWGFLEKAWLRANEWMGALFGNRLIADHPEIASHLTRHGVADKIVVIPYGADALEVDDEALIPEQLRGTQFATLIARPEPENSVLELVRGFSARDRNGLKLAVLGKYDLVNNPYHREILAAASADVIFLGPIYEKSVVAALRSRSCFYMHGHTVGGTNPSLVEALGASNPVIAHDNRFNRWVIGNAGLYFSDVESASICIDKLAFDSDLRSSLSNIARKRHLESFTWRPILDSYRDLLLGLLPRRDS